MYFIIFVFVFLVNRERVSLSEEFERGNFNAVYAVFRRGVSQCFEREVYYFYTTVMAGNTSNTPAFPQVGSDK